jgi:hypothetical protein
MNLPRVRITVLRMMVVVAMSAFGPGLWVWWYKESPSPRVRALELARSVPTASYYESAAIYQAAMFHEQVAPGSLTRLASLPAVRVSRINDGRPLPLAWKVTFTDHRSHKVFPTGCFIGIATVNDFLAIERAERQAGRASEGSSSRNLRPKKALPGGATPG